MKRRFFPAIPALILALSIFTGSASARYSDADLLLSAASGPQTSLTESADSDDTIHYIKIDTTYTSDSFLIQSNGVNMLVDTSYPDPATGGPQAYDNDAGNVQAVISYLASIGVGHLDYVVLTHNHSDHIGGVSAICTAGLIDENTTVYYRTHQRTDEDEEDPQWCNTGYLNVGLEAVGNTGASVICLQDENITELTVPVGDFSVEFLNLDNDKNGMVDFSPANENDNSIVLKVTKGSIDTLLTADIEDVDEYALLNAEDLSGIEVLKAPHHGSTTSSTYEFLSAIQPEAVIVTSWRYRQGGAYEYLKGIGSSIYTTELCTAGAIVETVGDDSYSISNGQFYEETGNDGWLGWFDNFMYLEDGQPVRDSLKKISGSWYYFDADGLMQTGAVTIDGRDYYFDTDGKMQTGWVTVDGETKFYPPMWLPRLPFPGSSNADSSSE